MCPEGLKLSSEVREFKPLPLAQVLEKALGDDLAQAADQVAILQSGAYPRPLLSST
jgi:hypothetical protein